MILIKIDEFLYFIPIEITRWILNLLIGVIAFLGGCWGLASKRVGGKMAIIAGTLSIILLIVSYSIIFNFYTPYSLIGYVMNIIGITPIGQIDLVLETGLILLAGTLILVDGPE